MDLTDRAGRPPRAPSGAPAAREAQEPARSTTQQDSDAHPYLTFSQAARLAPGKPTPNCLWRWGRRGVLARGGGRIYLNHIRSGGKMYTTAEWVEAFCREFTEADRAYFDAKEASARDLPPRDNRYGPPSGRGRGGDAARNGNHKELAELERELQEEGL